MSNTNYPVQYTIPVQDLDMDWFREQDWQKASSEAFIFFSYRPKSPAPQPVDGVSPPYYDQRLSAGPIPSISLLGLR